MVYPPFLLFIHGMVGGSAVWLALLILQQRKPNILTATQELGALGHARLP